MKFFRYLIFGTQFPFQILIYQAFSPFLAWTLRHELWGTKILCLDKVLSSQVPANYILLYINLSSAAWISGNEQNLGIAFTLIFSADH